MNRFLAAIAVLLASSTVSGCGTPLMLPIMVANDVVGAIQTELERSEPMPKLARAWEDGGVAPVPMETASSSIAYDPEMTGVSPGGKAGTGEELR